MNRDRGRAIDVGVRLPIHVHQAGLRAGKIKKNHLPELSCSDSERKGQVGLRGKRKIRMSELGDSDRIQYIRQAQLFL